MRSRNQMCSKDESLQSKIREMFPKLLYLCGTLHTQCAITVKVKSPASGRTVYILSIPFDLCPFFFATS